MTRQPHTRARPRASELPCRCGLARKPLCNVRMTWLLRCRLAVGRRVLKVGYLLCLSLHGEAPFFLTVSQLRFSWQALSHACACCCSRQLRARQRDAVLSLLSKRCVGAAQVRRASAVPRGRRGAASAVEAVPTSTPQASSFVLSSDEEDAGGGGAAGPAGGSQRLPPRGVRRHGAGAPLPRGPSQPRASQLSARALGSHR